jgi:hypothetical protein
MQRVELDTAQGITYFERKFIACPNPECKKLTLEAAIRRGIEQGRQVAITAPIHRWRLLPRSRAQAVPDYVPEVIRLDYGEACLIVDDSPKASATLSRRCLQGMIRDYWGIVKGRLVDEVDALRERVDPAMWKAIDAVRSVGNIGAHMEKDVDLVIDVEPGEAEKLIGLVESLIREWYVARHSREAALRGLAELAERKEEERKRGGEGAAEGG